MKAAPFFLGLGLAASFAGCRKLDDTVVGQRAAQPSATNPDDQTTSSETGRGKGKLENVGGTATHASGGSATPAADGTTPTFSLNPDLPVVVRGRWAMSLANGEDGLALSDNGNGNGLGVGNPHNLVTLYNVGTPDEVATQQMNGTVPTQVVFNVTNEGFTDNPTVSNGVVSYGFLTLAALYDNNTRVCGASGTVKCATAAVRLYTTTTPAAGQAPNPAPTTGGAGLWNSSIGVGLPILSGSGKVGYGSANALVIGVDQLTSKNVITLGDFTFAAGTQVPLAVDFTNAPAGSYSATLVIEYVVQ